MPASSEGTNEFFEGDPIELVQIVAMDSDFGRAKELESREAYDALPAGQQGTIEYYSREKSGRESLISQVEYEALANPARKGPIKYFRKEIPRIAEIEVWAPGDNLNLGGLRARRLSDG